MSAYGGDPLAFTWCPTNESRYQGRCCCSGGFLRWTDHAAKLVLGPSECARAGWSDRSWTFAIDTGRSPTYLVNQEKDYDHSHFITPVNSVLFVQSALEQPSRLLNLPNNRLTSPEIQIKTIYVEIRV